MRPGQRRCQWRALLWAPIFVWTATAWGQTALPPLPSAAPKQVPGAPLTPPALPPASSTAQPPARTPRPAVLPGDSGARPSISNAPVVMEGPTCPNGYCEPFYRIRPKGTHDQKRSIKVYNRLNEPDWYKYYRCEHYGYYPTQWAPWPEGWLACRRPYPGPHPYDLKQPENAGIRRDRNADRNNAPTTRERERRPANPDADRPDAEPDVLPPPPRATR